MYIWASTFYWENWLAKKTDSEVRMKIMSVKYIKKTILVKANNKKRKTLNSFIQIFSSRSVFEVCTSLWYIFCIFLNLKDEMFLAEKHGSQSLVSFCFWVIENRAIVYSWEDCTLHHSRCKRHYNLKWWFEITYFAQWIKQMLIIHTEFCVVDQADEG